MPSMETRLWLDIRTLDGKVQQLQAENQRLAKQVQELTELVKSHLAKPHGAEKAERQQKSLTDGE